MGPSQSRTNWLQRPLTDAQRRYAAEDVRWLFRLHDRFVRRMSDDEEQQRFGWLREETQTRLDRLSRRETDRWRRLSGANKLSPRSLAALRELSSWRESVASARNIPFRRIASDDLLVAVSATRPTSQSELSSVRGVGQLKQSYFSRRARRDRDGALAARSRAADPRDAASWRQAVADGGALPGVGAGGGVREASDRPGARGRQFAALRALVSWNEGGRSAEHMPRLLTGWRGEVCAEPLLDALAGRISPADQRPTVGQSRWPWAVYRRRARVLRGGNFGLFASDFLSWVEDRAFWCPDLSRFVQIFAGSVR